MGWVDRIPRAGNLNIGGLGALFQPDHLLQKAGVTHVLSILDYDINAAEVLQGMEHLQIRSEDVPNENLLQHFGRTNAFIDRGLREGGGGVYVHCAMGKSRSATLVCAYLMWKYGRGAAEALAQICEGRPICEPNAGFLEQLEVYDAVLKTGDVEGREARRIVEEWERTKFRGHVWEWEEWNAARARGKL